MYKSILGDFHGPVILALSLEITKARRLIDTKYLFDYFIQTLNDELII